MIVLQESSDIENVSKKAGQAPGVVTSLIHRRIIELCEKGSTPQQIVHDPLVLEEHLTEKKICLIVNEYEAAQVLISNKSCCLVPSS